jgi:hypothetical protein
MRTNVTFPPAVPNRIIGAALALQAASPDCQANPEETRIVTDQRNRNCAREARKSRITFALEAAGVLSVLLLGAMVQVAALQHLDPEFKLNAAQLQASHPAMPHIRSR